MRCLKKSCEHYAAMRCYHPQARGGVICPLTIKCQVCHDTGWVWDMPNQSRVTCKVCRIAERPRVSDLCMVCGETTLGKNARYPITVDDGKPAGTPNRWRIVGYACVNHQDEANRIATAALTACGDCDPCLGGRPDQCAVMGIANATAPPPQRSGGRQQQIVGNSELEDA